MPRTAYWLLLGVAGVCFVARAVTADSERGPEGPDAATRAGDSSPHVAVNGFVERYCIDCHSNDQPASGFDLSGVTLDAAREQSEQSEQWEKVVRRLRARQMPPIDADRPNEDEYRVVLAAVEETLDAAAAAHPQPGQTATFRRLTRTEYGYAIRDLLALDVDVDALLPADQASHGFDNVTVGDLSPTRLSRYLTAAEKISRLAVGSRGRSPGGHTVRLPADRTQEEHVEGLPLGTRGGVLFRHNFPRDGEYEIRVRLARDRNEHIAGLHGEHQLDALLDGQLVESFTVDRPAKDKTASSDYEREGHANVDAHLKTRFRASAGPHEVGVAFVKGAASLLETARQPLDVRFNFYRHPRQTPAVYEVTVTGPYDDSTPGETPSRQRIFIDRPDGPEDEERCAERILSNLARRAYRRPVGETELTKLMRLYRGAYAGGGFESGIEAAVAGVLVSPRFLFRIEQPPADAEPGDAYAVDDLALASRLSFFLWSSLPDDELLDVAERGQLSQPGELRRQVERMLTDERSIALVENFADQWLYLRNLDSVSPDMRRFPNFDDNLRQAMRRETELLFQSVMREDRSVLDLLQADYTHLNERLAKHYDIPGVLGSRFRRVELQPGMRRGGLLRHASVLTVTSYATRTSPVLRGTWILENLLGSPPPPPPADVPTLEDNTVAAGLSVRERLAEHRANAACAVCHDSIDPIGFCLENYDAVGQWRDLEAGQPVDASGGLPDGSRFTGVAKLEEGLIARPEIFVTALAEKLVTYALGRGVEPFDGPAIRRIVREASADGYRFSSLIRGIVQSPPFLMRTAP